LTLLNVSIAAMQHSLRALKNGDTPPPVLDFAQLTQAVGFPEYYVAEQHYKLD
jgi:hypothetical protein